MIFKFAPGPDCEQLVVSELAGARKTVLMQAYGFTSKAILKALLDAQRHKADVRAILDAKTASMPGQLGSELHAGKAEVWLDGDHPIAHNKVIIIDGHLVLTGSYNFTEHAKRNAENLVATDNAFLAAAYTKNWQDHLGHSSRWPPHERLADWLTEPPPAGEVED